MKKNSYITWILLILFICSLIYDNYKKVIPVPMSPKPSATEISNIDKSMVNPYVTSETLNQTICKVGYTKGVRPSTSYTNRIKYKLLRDIGKSELNADLYELDHIIPLTVGGNARSPTNLWLQPWPEARIKDKDEVRLNKCVCDKTISLETAQLLMINWKSKLDNSIYKFCKFRNHR